MTATFGSALREYRMAHGLTQEALAERALLSPTAIAALERGRNRSPRMSTLQQLAKALELDPEEMAELARTFADNESAGAFSGDRGSRQGVATGSEPRDPTSK